MEDSWFVYMVECRDGSLYTGITNDLTRRLAAHNAGVASKYTRARRPVRLVYHESCESRQEALIRECAVKLLSRDQKSALVRGHTEGQAAKG